jgi:Leucine-rich repeat (LRR) protein
MSVQYKGKEIKVSHDWLNLSNRGVGDIGELKGLDRLTQLEGLNLAQNQIIKISGIVTLTRLQSLNLSGNKITRIEGLDTLAQLRSLNLANNAITKIEGFANSGALQILDLTNNPVEAWLKKQLGEKANDLGFLATWVRKYCQKG